MSSSSSRLKRGSSGSGSGSMNSSTSSSGLKGMLKSVGKFGYNSAISITSNGKIIIKHSYNILGSTGFAVATTAMIVFMPLLFEIARESQMLETDRSLVKDLRSRGYSDRQLADIGFSELSLHSPPVAATSRPK